jgi:hypothetical protein
MPFESVHHGVGGAKATPRTTSMASRSIAIMIRFLMAG